MLVFGGPHLLRWRASSAPDTRVIFAHGFIIPFTCQVPFGKVQTRWVINWHVLCLANCSPYPRIPGKIPDLPCVATQWGVSPLRLSVGCTAQTSSLELGKDPASVFKILFLNNLNINFRSGPWNDVCIFLFIKRHAVYRWGSYVSLSW